MTIARLTGGLTPADGSDPRTFPAIWNDAVDDIEQAEADIAELETVGFRYVGTRYYTSDGTFAKADPFGDSSFDGAKMRAIRVTCVGGGGGGGGSETTGAGEVSLSGGGGAGGTGIKFITDIAGLSASVNVTRGGGGAAGTTGVGTSGGSSSFNTTTVVGNGGAGGGRFGAVGILVIEGGTGAASGTGDLVINGGRGRGGFAIGTGSFQVTGGDGGNSTVGTGGLGARFGVDSVGGAGGAGAGGGGIGIGASTTSRSGGAGGNGLVKIDVFA